MLRVAITGNIASGKSQVETIITKMGYSVFDTDIIAHKILDNITEFYGYDVFTDGKIDRLKLGKLVFSNNKIKKQLEDVIHPLVKNEINNLFEKHGSEKAIFISVPLLFEASFTDLFDSILFISCPENIRLNRLMKRNNLNKKDAENRIKAQMPEELKIKHSDYVILNNSDIKDLEIKVKSFIKSLNLD